MADVVNLRQVRKRKAKAAQEVQAAENRALFGKPKAERKREAAQKSIEEKKLDGHRRDNKD